MTAARAVWLLGAVVLLRALLAWASGASLHVDEAQYWDWSRDLQWGYFSKPPLIAALIAASSRLFGDSEAGLRALAMACWPLTAGVLGLLARRLVGVPMAAYWAGGLFICSPLAALLGQAVTTDAPLLLAWSLALLGLWLAVEEGRRGGWWLFGLALGMGLLGKYTMAALLPGAAVWVLWRAGWQALMPLALAAAGGLALLGPNLWWNAQADWPTMRHTAEITVQSGRALSVSLIGLVGLGGYLAAQIVLVAPVAAPWISAAGRRGGAALGRPAWRFLLCLHLPLLLAGLLQAAKGHAELNWIAPVHLAALVALAGLAAARGLGARSLLAVLAAQWLLVSLLAGGWTLAARAARVDVAPPLARLDVWARMRGWPEALTGLTPALQTPPGAPPPLVIVTGRTLAAQTAYHWRGRAIERAILAGTGRPGNHYEMRCPWHADLGVGRAVFVLSEGPLDADMAQSLGGVEPVASADRPGLAGSLGRLHLGRLLAPERSLAASRSTGVCR